MLSTEDKLHAQIMQNHREVGRNYGYSLGVSGTIDVVISCMEGDSVFVRHMPGQGAEKIHGGGYSAFFWILNQLENGRWKHETVYCNEQHHLHCLDLRISKLTMTRDETTKRSFVIIGLLAFKKINK